MSDSDRNRIKQLDQMSDYTLWRARIVAACAAKGIENVLKDERVPDGGDEPNFSEQ